VTEVETLKDGFRIVEHNCAILGVAVKYGQACTSELEFIRAALPDAAVQRVSHILAGAFSCAYEVRPAQPQTARSSQVKTARTRAR
jgi:DeoR family transcriptional regulator, suf operon transcriptional repressor